MRTPASTRWRYRKAPYDKKREEESGWYALAAAIVQQAVEDYRTAVEQKEKPKHNYCPNCGAKMEPMEVQE